MAGRTMMVMMAMMECHTGRVTHAAMTSVVSKQQYRLQRLRPNISILAGCRLRANRRQSPAVSVLRG